MLFVFFFFQEQLISTDPLTRLNNRNVMLRYLGQKMDARDRNQHLVLFILDIDNFKDINDQYGHVQGDAALERTASILKSIAARFNCFLARYGGDEFIIIGEFKNLDEGLKLIDDIHMATEISNEMASTPYQLSFSIGATELTPEIKYIPDFIAEADKALYRSKRSKDITR